MTRFTVHFVIPKPVVLTNFSGHTVNAIVKKLCGKESTTNFFATPISYDDEPAARCIYRAPLPLEPSRKYFFRLTSISTELSKTFASSVIGGSQLHLQDSEITPVGVDVEALTRDTLIKPPYPKRFAFKILSPARFGFVGDEESRTTRGIFDLFPGSERVFSNLARTWNMIAKGYEVDLQKYLAWVRGNLYVAPPFRLRSETVRLGGGREVPGCVGLVSFETCDPQHEYHAFSVALARMAEYTGVGSQRRLGFGTVELYEEPTEEPHSEATQG